MRYTYAHSLKQNVSALAFGCASLGSRISARKGRRAIDVALEAGVSWFDVAPPYGDGEAEEILGESLKGRRDRVVLCTKFGISRPEISPFKRLFRPAARIIVQSVPRLRSRVSKSRSAGTRSIITREKIESSVVESLRKLKTDYVDVLAIHEPTDEESCNPEIYDEVDRLISRGMVRAVSIGGSRSAIVSALNSGRILGFAQFPDQVLNQPAPIVAMPRFAEPLPTQITHSILGRSTLLRYFQMPSATRTELAVLCELPDRRESAAAVLTRLAFARNPNGVVLLSMYSLEHIHSNAEQATRKLEADFLSRAQKILRAKV